MALVEILCHSLAQRQQAVSGCVTVMAIPQRLDCSLDNVGGRFKIRLADAEVDDVLALRLQRGCAGQYLECCLCAKPVEAVSGAKHGAIPRANMRVGQGLCVPSLERVP